MIVSEIASGTPHGQTFADERIFLLVESQSAEQIIAQLVEDIEKLANPTLPELSVLADRAFVRNSTILLFVAGHNRLHIVSRGDGTIFLKRGEKAGTLLAGNSSATGPLESRDIFILAGPSFLSAVTPSVLTILLEKTADNEVEEKIIAYLEQNTQTNALCLLIHNAPVPQSEPIIHELPDPHARSFLPNLKFSKWFTSFSPQSKQQKITVIVGAVILALLVVSLMFGSRERQRVNNARAFEKLKTTVSSQISEAETLVDITPEQAEPLLAQALATLTQNNDMFPSETPEHTELMALIARVEELRGRAHRKYTVEPTVFFDISWVKETGQGKRLTISNDNLFILDTTHGAVYKVGLTQKKSEITGTQEAFKNGVAVTLFRDEPYIFVEGNPTKVVNAKGEEAIAHNDSWGVIVDAKSYGGNIYLLDRNNQIWKTPGSESGFGSGSRWLSEDAQVDFSGSKAMAIDGNIWVLTEGTIVKLAVGGQDPFFLSEEAPTHGKAIWTSETSKYLYVLENSRIVVFDKKGNYYAQYAWDGLVDATDIAVSEPLGKLLILKQDKVYAIDVKT